MFLRLAFFVCLLFPLGAAAHVPVLSLFISYEDAKTIISPDISRAYYGELTSFPHRYEFAIDESNVDLFVEVLVPDIEEAENNIDAIIVKQHAAGYVDEVARLYAKDAMWESFFEWFGGDSYRRGPGFAQTVEPGNYILEVYNANNTGKYVLVVGKKEDFSEVSFFETLKRIYGVKQFYGKSPLAVLQSPFYYVPTIIVLAIIAVIFWYRKRKQQHYA